MLKRFLPQRARGAASLFLFGAATAGAAVYFSAIFLICGVMICASKQVAPLIYYMVVLIRTLVAWFIKAAKWKSIILRKERKAVPPHTPLRSLGCVHALRANGIILYNARKGVHYITSARALERQTTGELSAKISESKFLACNHETLFTLMRARFEMFYTQRAGRALALAKLPTLFFLARCAALYSQAMKRSRPGLSPSEWARV